MQITVFNDAGLPALWASLRGGKLQVSTDRTWETSLVGGTWSLAQLAGDPLPLRAGSPLYGAESGFESLRARFPLYADLTILFAALLGISLWWRSQLSSAASAEKWSWFAFIGFAAAWIVLWSNNLGYLPPLEGFDVAEHLKYIDYILERHSLPLANEGFEMYQPPLYYLLSAAILVPFHLSATHPTGIFLLRLFGLACGITAFLLVFLSLRLLFPRQPRLQFFGLALSALLPANLYLCHYLTNEILSTVLIAAGVYACLRILANPTLSLAQHASTGAIWGAALLAKTSAIVLLPIGLLALAWNLRGKASKRPSRWPIYVALPLVLCLAVCGWHYLRVANHFGNPLIGNWDPQSGFNWWQQKGFRCPADFWHWGQSLKRPFFSAMSSFPDGVYSTLWGDGLWGGNTEIESRPPWNYGLMASGYILSLAPTFLVLIGFAVAVGWLWRQPRADIFFIMAIALLLAGLMVFYSIKVPSYAAGKAFYASGGLISLCVFGALGGGFLSRFRGVRIVVYLAFFLWGVNSYASFWIRHDGRQTQLLIAQGQSKAGRHDLAVATMTNLLARWPHDTQTASWLSFELLEMGNIPEAERIAAESLSWAKDDAGCHLAMGSVFVVKGQLDKAVPEARRAAQLARDHPLAARALGDWLYRSGRPREAIAACREAIRIRPMESKPHLILSKALSDTGSTNEAAFHANFAASLKEQ